MDSKPMAFVRTLRVILLMFLLSVFSVGIEPAPPPYHTYVVDGRITRPGSVDLSGFAVVLLARFPFDTAFQILRPMKSQDSPLSITDASGMFFLQLSSWEKADSLQVGAIRVEQLFATGIPFAVDSSQAIAMMETYQASGETGCMGCLTQPETKERIQSYRYGFSNVILSVPY